MNVYDERSIGRAPWPDTEEGRKARSFLVPLFQQGVHAFFEEHVALCLLDLDGVLIPVSVNEPGGARSNLFSPLGRYIGATLAGIERSAGSTLRRWGMGVPVRSLGVMLGAARTDRCVFVDNWPLLRNMGAHLEGDQVQRLTRGLMELYPRHALVFPALSVATHSLLLNHLADTGYEMAYAGHTRMLLPWGLEPNKRGRENRRRDARLLESSGYRVVEGRQMPGCAVRLAELYRQLNRQKYATNPPVTSAFFEAALRGEMIEFRLFVKDGRIDSFYGFMVRGEVLFSAVAGYDLGVPPEVGLYRILISALIKEALQRGLAIETGAGADDFKRRRGDRALPRYNAVYLRHLPSWQQAGWRLLVCLANGPLLGGARLVLRKIERDPVVGFEGIPGRFAPTFLTPRESVEQLGRRLDALEEELEATSDLGGAEQQARLAALARQMENWLDPPGRLVRLRERLEAHRRRLHNERKSLAQSARILRRRTRRRTARGQG